MILQRYITSISNTKKLEKNVVLGDVLLHAIFLQRLQLSLDSKVQVFKAMILKITQADLSEFPKSKSETYTNRK